jgi:hypothetical protein
MSNCRVIDYSGRRWCETHGCWAQLCQSEIRKEQEREQLERVKEVQAEEWPVVPS